MSREYCGRRTACAEHCCCLECGYVTGSDVDFCSPECERKYNARALTRADEDELDSDDAAMLADRLYAEWKDSQLGGAL